MSRIPLRAIQIFQGLLGERPPGRAKVWRIAKCGPRKARLSSRTDWQDGAKRKLHLDRGPAAWQMGGGRIAHEQPTSARGVARLAAEGLETRPGAQRALRAADAQMTLTGLGKPWPPSCLWPIVSLTLKWLRARGHAFTKPRPEQEHVEATDRVRPCIHKSVLQH